MRLTLLLVRRCCEGTVNQVFIQTRRVVQQPTRASLVVLTRPLFKIKPSVLWLAGALSVCSMCAQWQKAYYLVRLSGRGPQGETS